MDTEFDVLIVFVGITSVPETNAQTVSSNFLLTEKDINSMICEDSKTVHSFGHLVEIDWCAYDLKQQMVLTEVQQFIKPEGAVVYSLETLKATNIKPDDFMRAVPLKDFVSAFNDFCYFNFTKNNLSYCLVTLGDDLFTKQFQFEVREQKIKLPLHFYSYFDLICEFKKFYANCASVKSIHDMLKHLNLKDIPINYFCQYTCKNCVRVLNKLVKDGHKFHTPKMINQLFKVVTMNEEAPDRNIAKRQKKWGSYIRGRSPEAFRNPSRSWYLRLRGLPYHSREPEIIEFMRGTRIYSENIAFMYDVEGKFTGDCYVRLINEDDYSRAKSFHKSAMGNRYIEIYDATETDFQRAINSQFPEKRDYTFNPTQLEEFVSESCGIVKLRGLPYSATDEDIRVFFSGLPIHKNGIKRAIIAGKPSGECYVIFESKEDMQKALCLNMEKIGSRFIEIFSSNLREFETFMSRNFVNSGPDYSKDNMPNLPIDVKKQTALITNLPLDTTKEEIILVLRGFSVYEKNVHLISNAEGSFRGSALVTFEDELECQRAIKSKNLTFVRDRYIELYEFKQE